MSKTLPEILLKRAYLPPSPDDGVRILVDRLWPRGIKRESLDAVWLKDLAPSNELRKWLHADPSRWDAFVQRYCEELVANPEALSQIDPYLAKGRATLIYGARNEAQNHAMVLRDYVLRAYENS